MFLVCDLTLELDFVTLSLTLGLKRIELVTWELMKGLTLSVIVELLKDLFSLPVS